MQSCTPATTPTRPPEACSTAFSSTAEPNSRRTRPSSLSRNSGARSPSLPPSTKLSPPRPSATVGPLSSAAPGSPTNRPTGRSNPRLSDRSQPNYAAPKPTTTMSTRLRRGLSLREGSATPTTSPPSSTTASNERLHDRQDQDEPGNPRASSLASSHTPTA